MNLLHHKLGFRRSFLWYYRLQRMYSFCFFLRQHSLYHVIYRQKRRSTAVILEEGKTKEAMNDGRRHEYQMANGCNSWLSIFRMVSVIISLLRFFIFFLDLFSDLLTCFFALVEFGIRKLRRMKQANADLIIPLLNNDKLWFCSFNIQFTYFSRNIKAMCSISDCYRNNRN